MDKNQVHGLVPHQGNHVPWASRDYALEIPCKRAACIYNDKRDHCGVPTRCDLDENSRCLGFTAESTPKKTDSE